MSGIHVEIPRSSIEQIAREVCEEIIAQSRPAIQDSQAEEITRRLQRINAKQFITIREFAFLFGCSNGYVGKLIEKAQDPKTEYPVPYVDLDGLTQFDRVEVLAWAKTSKPLRKHQRKQGGKRPTLVEAVNQ